MGKALIIRDSDFSVNALGNIYAPVQLNVTRGDWSANYNNGKITTKNPIYYASNVIDVRGYKYVSGQGVANPNKFGYIFYSDMPQMGENPTIFLGGGEVTANSWVEIPSGTKYLVVCDTNGTTTSTIGVIAYAKIV